jgi:hypothetical protein
MTKKVPSTIRQDIEKLQPELPLKFPSEESLAEIALNLRLSQKELSELRLVLGHVVIDVNAYVKITGGRNSKPSRVKRLKKINGLLTALIAELAQEPQSLLDVLPNDTLEHIGQGLSLSGMAETLGMDAYPKGIDRKLNSDEFRAEILSVAKVESMTLTKRSALGLLYGPSLLVNYLAKVHAPLRRLADTADLSVGGRKKDYARHHLVYWLALMSEEILGKEASINTEGRFVDLCSLVMEACGLDPKGVNKLVPRVVPKARADMKRQGAFE